MDNFYDATITANLTLEIIDDDFAVMPATFELEPRFGPHAGETVIS